MRRAEILRLLRNAEIKQPCPIKTVSMSADEKVRFCHQCNLNVQNLSAMSDDDAAEVLRGAKYKKTCVFFYRDKNGTIVTDNCPQLLRPTRDRGIRFAATALLIVATGLYVGVASQMGVIHQQASIVPVTPRLISSCGGVPEPFYDSKPIAFWLGATFVILSYLLFFFLPLSKSRKYTVKVLLLEAIALAAIPLILQLAHTAAPKGVAAWPGANYSQLDPAMHQRNEGGYLGGV